MGKPGTGVRVIPKGKPTRGTETSKYPQERKSNETPSVAASERGIEGDTPVCESGSWPVVFLSTLGHVKSGGKLGGPSSKAKYYLLTDSERVP